MFHLLTHECANSLVGTNRAARSNEAWHQVHRALDHGYVKGQCKNKEVVARFPKKIEDFANLFITMQAKRHKADYDPFINFTKSEVENDLTLVDQALKDFAKAPLPDRRAFCIWILLKDRKS